MHYVTGIDPAWPAASARQDKPITALVLAGDRQRPDPVAAAAGTPCKVMAPVGGTPLIERVTDALRASGVITSTALVGPERSMLQGAAAIGRGLDEGHLRWLAQRSSPAASTLAGLDDLDNPWPVLVTTGDHALLTPAMVSTFVDVALAQPWDAAVAVVPHRLVSACYPQASPTATRLSDGAVCGCNLFALASDRARELVASWQRLEQQRKSPIRTVASAIGIRSLGDYAMGRLTLAAALRRLSHRMGLTIGAVMLPYAAAGLDVDSPRDWELASRIVGSSTDQAM